MLVEFALIAIAFYLLLAAAMEIGRMVFSAQLIQNAARVGARELAVTALPPTFTFEQALHDSTVYGATVRQYVYDPGLLAYEVTPGTSDLQVTQAIANWPPLNRMLAPLMIREKIEVNGVTHDMLRYPGALLKNPGFGVPPNFDANEFNVGVPQVVSTDANGSMTVEWHQVVEEVRADPNDPASGHFSMTSHDPRGLVGLRVNYPFQAASLSMFKQTPGQNGTVFNDPVLANDASVSADTPPPGLGSPEDVSGGSQTYSGLYGLGVQFALGKEVRPFRRVLSAQSIFRREVFAQ